MKKSLALFSLLFLLGTSCTLRVHEATISPPPPPPRVGPPPWAPAPGYRYIYRYRYYPSLEVYVDIDRNLYFYFYMDKWYCTPTPPPHIKIEGEYVILEMGTDTPYIYHKEVIKYYPPKKGKHKHW